MTQWPSLVPTFSTKTNEVDLVDASHVNLLQNEVIALGTNLGTNPQGNRVTMAHRLYAVLSGSGGFVLASAVPTETYPGKAWYRTDLDVVQVVKADNTVQSLGGSLSNVIFQSSLESTGNIGGANDFNFLINQANLQGATSSTAFFSYWNVGLSTGWLRMRTNIAWKKITGITTLRSIASHWCVTGGGREGQFSFGIGTTTVASGSIVSGTGSTLSDFTIDVSGLTVGSVYSIQYFYRQTSAGGGDIGYLGP